MILFQQIPVLLLQLFIMDINGKKEMERYQYLYKPGSSQQQAKLDEYAGPGQNSLQQDIISENISIRLHLREWKQA